MAKLSTPTFPQAPKPSLCQGALRSQETRHLWNLAKGARNKRSSLEVGMGVGGASYK